jgi:diguanylate cyclase (GGDEF)-like protein/PAS domain S-box-containing protein
MDHSPRGNEDAGNESLFREIVETADFGVGVINKNGSYLFANRKWAEMTGYAPEEILSRSVSDITLPEDLDETRQKVRDLFSGSISSYTIEKRIRRQDGSWFWGKVVATPLKDKAGNVTAINGLIADITPQKQALKRIETDAAIQRLASRITAHSLTLADSSTLLQNLADILVDDSPFQFSAFYRESGEPLAIAKSSRSVQGPDETVIQTLVSKTHEETRPVVKKIGPGKQKSVQMIGFPITRMDRPWGVLVLAAFPEDLLLDDPLPMLDVLVGSISAVLESESLAGINRALRRISRLIGSRPTPSHLFEETCRTLVDDGGLLDAAILRFEPDTLSLVPVVVRGNLENAGEAVRKMRFNLSPGHSDNLTGMAEAVRTGLPVLTQDFSERFSQPGLEQMQKWARRFHWRSGASFPLYSQAPGPPGFPSFSRGRVIGLLTVTSKETGFFHDRLVQLLEEAANILGVALDRHEEDRIHAESRDKLSRVTELYAALNGINRLVNQRPSEQGLFDETCRIINEIGMLYLVRILAVDCEADMLKPVAVHARSESMVSFFRELTYRTDPETREKLRNLSPQACLVKKKPVIHHNLVKELESIGLGTLSAKAIEFGLWSQGSFPVTRNGQISYILSAFAERVGFFDGPLVSLLEEISRTLSTALDNLDRDREKQKAEEALKSSEEKYRLLMEEAGDGILIVDLETETVVDANRQACRLFGFEKSDLVGLKKVALFPQSSVHLTSEDPRPPLSPSDWEMDDRPVRYHIQNPLEGPREVEVLESRINWRDRPLLQIRLRDVTDLHFYESELKRMAREDSLTGLLNRHALWNELESILAESSPKLRIALFYIDLDNFKIINDTYGHETGDRLLKIVSQRLKTAVRENEIVARVGGDEFLVLATDSISRERVERIAKRILSVLEVPVSLNGQEFTIHASLGISFFPDDAANPEDLIRTADNAMYRSKREGRNRFTFHAIPAD